MGVYELIEGAMEMSMNEGSFDRKADLGPKTKAFDTAALDAAKPEIEKIVKFIGRVVEKVGPLPADSFRINKADKAAVSESIARRQEAGKQLLTGLYGAADFPDSMMHSAGTALEAFRSGNTVKGEFGAEQLYMAAKRMGLKTYEEHKADMDAAVSDLRTIAGPKSEDENPKATE